MKFSDINREEWGNLQPYIDTCLVPVTGLTGREQPWEAAELLEELRDVLDMIEIPFKGRIMTYPAMHYLPSERAALSNLLNETSLRLKESGFKHVIFVTANPEVQLSICHEADLCVEPSHYLQPDKSSQQILAERVQELWQPRTSSSLK